MQVINRVRYFRKERGISQGELADALGVSRQTINAIETGKYNPSLELALLISWYFHQPIEQIFTLDRKGE